MHSSESVHITKMLKDVGMVVPKIRETWSVYMQQDGMMA